MMKKRLVLYPSLIILNFILTFAAYNLKIFHPSSFIRPAIVSVLITVLILLLIYAMFRDWDRAAVGSLIVATSIYRYEYIIDSVSRFTWLPDYDGLLLLIIAIITGILFVVSTLKSIWERVQKPELITNLFNIVAIAMIVVPLYTLFSGITHNADLGRNARAVRDAYAQSIACTEVDDPSSLPDIYYIILDAYGRSDILDEIYDYDNGALTAYLESNGFYIAEQSTSNYPQTALSLSSSLNMHYLDAFVADIPMSTERLPLNTLLEDSIVRRLVEAQGYQTVSISSGYDLVQMDKNLPFRHATGLPINLFESYLLSKSMIRPIAELFHVTPFWPGYELHLAKINNAFEQLKSAPLAKTSPKFVFAHILVPHAPFVFDAEGNFTLPPYRFTLHDASNLHRGDPESQQIYVNSYRNQIAYVDQLVMEMIDEILLKSDREPLIIIQGDHGPGALFDFEELENTCVHERLSILNAYHVPQDMDVQLYPGITPVNSFRVILNSLLDTNLEIIEDKSYYTTWEHPYIFYDVTNEVGKPCTLPWE